MLGLYVLALRASCVDPAQVTDHTNTSPIDLVRLLQDKLAAEMNSIVMDARPVTSYYEVALALLGLCEIGSPVSEMDVQAFSDAVRKGFVTQVDTEAVSALALRCLQQGSSQPEDTVRDARLKLTLELYSARTDQHTIGNIYSTGLAAQALFANEDIIPPAVWGAREVLQELGALAELGAFQVPVSASQVLPALLRKSFLDAGRIPCSATVQSGPVTYGLSEISVRYTVKRDEGCTHACSHSVVVTVPAGSTILDVMKVAALKDPGDFKFSTERSAWGEYVVSIGGTEANTRDKTYWQFLVGSRPIPVGVAAYKLSDGDHVVAKFTTY
ncbi:cobalamin binding intrinsic factor-like isoform X2 [Hypanus sabinus]|uniref:cobalamin binding intrinsic factor-like isoform X2 n=1 Tax=Hypanus sabinus TaxID=79690 RepID=UPI0028C43444|nr:cobalamin binding intrinsic factor-like isoform X2 [Hypanus sabinus]